MDFSSWWTGMEIFERIYWIFAIPSSIFFVGILLMTFIGGDVDGDTGGADADVETDDGIGFQFFTLKNLVGFFTVFSWSGIACIDSGFTIPLTLLVSTISGTAMIVIMATIFYFMSKLSDSGTLSLNNAIGGIGEIYLPVKANREAFGKIQINIQGGLRTLQAVTDDEQDLPVGTVVEVLDVINDQILLVTKSSK